MQIVPHCQESYAKVWHFYWPCPGLKSFESEGEGHYWAAPVSVTELTFSLSAMMHDVRLAEAAVGFARRECPKCRGCSQRMKSFSTAAVNAAVEQCM